MENKDEALIKTLLDRDPELKQHYEEHVVLERQLADLQGRSHLTPEEEVEKKRIQKLKLAGKDRMMETLARHRPE
jgi:uncharacterized protein YdcH (DUF465 family)